MGRPRLLRSVTNARKPGECHACKKHIMEGDLQFTVVDGYGEDASTKERFHIMRPDPDKFDFEVRTCVPKEYAALVVEKLTTRNAKLTIRMKELTGMSIELECGIETVGRLVPAKPTSADKKRRENMECPECGRNIDHPKTPLCSGGLEVAS